MIKRAEGGDGLKTCVFVCLKVRFLVSEQLLCSGLFLQYLYSSSLSLGLGRISYTGEYGTTGGVNYVKQRIMLRNSKSQLQVVLDIKYPVILYGSTQHYEQKIKFCPRVSLRIFDPWYLYQMVTPKQVRTFLPCYLICLKQLIKSGEVTNRIFFRTRFFPLHTAHYVLIYHLI